MKGYTVFNAEQIEGLPDVFYRRPEPKHTGSTRIEHAEAFFANTRADMSGGPCALNGQVLQIFDA
jgi:antirestriction protein ArdC